MDLELKCDQVKKVDLMGMITMVIVVGRCSRCCQWFLPPGTRCLCEQCLWVWAGPSDLLLMKEIWQRWWNITPLILLPLIHIRLILPAYSRESFSLSFSLMLSLKKLPCFEWAYEGGIGGGHQKDMTSSWPLSWNLGRGSSSLPLPLDCTFCPQGRSCFK